MKILYICPTNGMFGDNKAILNIVPYLEKFGVEPIFYVSVEGTFTDKLKELGYFYIYGYDVFCSGMWPRWKTLRDFLGWSRREVMGIYHREYKRLLKNVEELKVDAIHSNLSTTTLGYSLAKDLGVPHFWHVREYGSLDHGYHQFPTKRLLQKKFNAPDTYTIFISEGIRNFYKNPINSNVIYDGPLDTKRPIDLFENKDKYFLYVGRLEETKGVHYAIRAFAEIYEYNPEYCLKIAGTGSVEYSRYLKKLVSDLGISNKVLFLGYQRDVYTLMQHAIAIIVPSRFEAFGFITSEALYNGCPVIGHNTAGTKEQMDKVISLNDSESKIVYPYNTESEISDYMKEAIKNRISEHKLRQLSDRVLSIFSAEKSAKQVYKVYQKHLEGKL